MKILKRVNLQYVIVIVVLVMIIFRFSNQSGASSKHLSDTVMRMLIRVFHINKEIASDQELIFGLTLRKFAHIFLYMLLGIFSFLSIKRSSFRPLIAGVICYILAAFDELHQYFVQGRTGKSQDTGIDAIGFCLAILVCWGISEFIFRRKRKEEEVEDESIETNSEQGNIGVL